MRKLSFINKTLVNKNSVKHIQCFYLVKKTQVHVGEREMLWEKKPDRAKVSTVCPVLTNFHECFSNSITTRIALRTIFLYIHLYKNRLHVLSLGCAHMEERASLSRDSFWFLFTPAFCVTCITTIFRHAM